MKRKMEIKKSPIVKVLMHLTIAIVLGVAITFLFFNAYLKSQTNHGETITVPDVVGTHLDDLDDALLTRELRDVVTADSSYSADYPPLSVIKQFPLPNSKVKEQRKVYVTLNMEKPPLVRMPNLIDGSIKNAQIVLKSYDLKLGKIQYVPDEIFNTVLKQQLDGREVLPDEPIPKGSTIDIVSGDGLGIVSLQSPNLVGLDAESAMVAIIGSGLKVGDVTHENEKIVVFNEEEGYTEINAGAVMKQSPSAGLTLRLGSVIDLWIYSPDSINTRPTLLDE